MQTPKEIETILPQIMDTVVSCVEKVLTEHIHSTKYLDEYYIKQKEFIKLIGLSSKTFSKLKKEGKFNKAMHPAARGGNRMKYHRWFNVYKQEIEIPDQNERPKLTTKMSMPKDISQQIMKTVVYCVERVLTEYIHSPNYLDKYYIDELDFIKLISLKPETFYDLKKKGIFDKAMLPDGDLIKYHRWFNYETGKIELPGLYKQLKKTNERLKMFKKRDI